MWGLILLATFVVMLGLIWYHEGWMKALKFFGLFFGTFFIYIPIATILNFENHDLAGILIWGGWTLFLVLYNIAKGYFTNPPI